MTHHPNTPAAIQAIRALLDASMVALTDVTTATPESVAIWNNAGEAIDALASRTEQAAPSVASGAPLPKGALGTLSNVIATLREYGRFEDEEGDATDILDDLHEWLQALADSAAPGAAIAAREREAEITSEQFTKAAFFSFAEKSVQLVSQIGTWSPDHILTKEGEQLLRSLNEVLTASRQEAPAASAQDFSGDFVEHSHPQFGAGFFCTSDVFERITSTAPTAARSPATVAQPVTDAQIIKVWNAWPRQGVTSRRTAVEFARAVLAIAPAAQPCPSQGCGGDEGEAVHVEAVATVVKRRHGLEWELELDWLAEGGISSLAEGAVLLLADSALTGDEGSGTVYRAALSTDKGDGGSKE